MTSIGSCSSQNNSLCGTNNTRDAGTEDTDAIVSELDDISALFEQMLLISDDRTTGHLGKLAANSDINIAIDYMLQEARELELSYRLAKSLSTCGIVPDDIIDELSAQDSQARNDRELAERVARQESSAESSLKTANMRFQVVLDYFNTTSDCCACSCTKRTYVAPCGHAYCEDCARSLYGRALTNRAFIPVRCCKEPFASNIAAVCLIDASDLTKYESIKCEIESPRPSEVELDVVTSKVISENGWKVCSRCGAVVERVSGCVHITCMCRAEFCYTCLKSWKTCTCELYPVAELNQILNERIGNDDPGIARHRLQNVLRNYYQHQHNWQRENSNGRICNVCRWNMPLYCMHCAVCMETRCQHCSFNN